MFIAMNRFKVIKEERKAFEDLWVARQSHLDEVEGFRAFHLLRGPEREDQVLYSGRQSYEVNAETAPLRNPEFYRYEFGIAQIAEVWRRSSVIGSWLLDLTAAALRTNPELTTFEGRRSPRPSHQRRLIWTVRVARAGGICRQAAVGDAIRIRWPRRENRKRRNPLNEPPGFRCDRFLWRHG
jgi:6-phosphogluconate dehydrogenase (decarboxylating)